MKILITGGTGTIGNYLVNKLLNSNHDLIVITRDIEGVKNDWKNEVGFLEADIKEKGEWKQNLPDHDAVINLIGEDIFSKRWTQNQKERLRRSRINSTQNLVDAIQDLENPPDVFVSVSGIDYYPPSEDMIYTENATPADSFIGDLTADWEAPVRQLQNTEIRHVIFRMGVALTYSGGGMERMFLPHKFFIGGWVGKGNQIYSWIHIEDFTSLLIWGVENEEIEGTYNGVAPDWKPMKEFAIIGGKIMGRWTWTWVPSFVLKLVLGERANLLLKGRAVSSDKVINAGYKFKYPTAEEALTDILEDF